MPTFELRTFGPGERPDDFWQLAGPVFGDAQAQRELGGPFTDDALTTWVIALDTAGALAGLASVREEKNVALLDHAYVRPEHRGQGIHGLLLQERIARTTAPKVRVMANPNSLTALLKLGFMASGKRGKYVVMEADALILRAKVTV